MTRLSIAICQRLTPYILSQCKSQSILTVTDFLSYDPEELSIKIKVPYKEVFGIRLALLASTPFPQNALSLFHELLDTLCILSTGSKKLDELLSGGIYTGELTEIYGPPGSGKTQFCMSVISHLIWGTRSTALYFDTNSNFSAKRMEQILMHISDGNQITACGKLESVKIVPVHSIYSFFDYIDVLKSELFKKEDNFFRCLKVIVIDSIASLLSPCFGEKYMNSMQIMKNVEQQLNSLCAQFKVSILVCNNTVESNSSEIKAALGVFWKYVPRISLCIMKLDSKNNHKIRSVKSCRNSLAEICFKISDAGIHD